MQAKLYGHGNPCFAVCVSNNGRIVASSCKAAESQQGLAGIRFWDASNWLQCGVLEGHKMTVTQVCMCLCVTNSMATMRVFFFGGCVFCFACVLLRTKANLRHIH